MFAMFLIVSESEAFQVFLSTILLGTEVSFAFYLGVYDVLEVP